MIQAPGSVVRVPILALIAVAVLTLSASASADDAPQLDAARATKIATDYLAHLGQNPPYIVSIVLEQDALIRGKRSWVARWSRPIVADGDKEVGLRVNLDGTIVRLVAARR